METFSASVLLRWSSSVAPSAQPQRSIPSADRKRHSRSRPRPLFRLMYGRRLGSGDVAGKFSVHRASEVDAAHQVLPQRLANASELDRGVAQVESLGSGNRVPPGDEEQVRTRRRGGVWAGYTVQNHLMAPSS